MKSGLMMPPWLCQSSYILQRGRTWRNCSHRAPSQHSQTLEIWNWQGSGLLLYIQGSLLISPTCRIKPAQFWRMDSINITTWSSLHMGHVWSQLLNLPAKPAWIILNCVPLQTPSVPQMSPRDHDKICSLLIPPPGSTDFVSVAKNLCDLQAQSQYAKDCVRPIASSTHHNLQTVLKRCVLLP